MPFALAAVAFFVKSYRNTNIVKIFNITKKNKYDYSKSVYINKRTKICIICPKHGEF